MAKGRLLRRCVAGGGVGLVVALVAPAVGVGAAPAATVQVGDFNRVPEIEFNAFYPAKITVAQGSKVKFSAFGFHTITFMKKGAKPPPFITSGPALNPPTNNPAGAPYWWGGTTPQLSINPAVPAPKGGTSVTGTKTVSSGFLPDNNPNFTVSFPKTGTFKVQCLVHPNMKGTVTVVPKGSSAVTTPAQLKVSVLKAKRSQRQAINQQIVKTRKAPANVVTISPGTNQGEAFGFFPANRSVPVGTAVTFKMAGRNEFHTVSFGPAAFLQAVGKTTFQGNGLAVAGEGSYPTNPPALGPPAVTPTANGNGFVSSGVLRDPGVSAPPPTSFTMVFPQPGVYKYICLIHNEMQGQITVG